MSLILPAGFLHRTPAAPPEESIFDELTGVTGAYSLSRKLLSDYGGTFYDEASAAVSSLNDQTGNSRHFTQGNSLRRPAIVTHGPNSRTCADFDEDLLTGPAISNFFSASTGYIAASVVVDAFVLNSGTPYLNHAVVADSSQFMGLYGRNDSPSINAYNWDSNADVAAVTAGVATDTLLVCEWIHTGGNLICCVNGGTDASVASGDTGSMNGLLCLFGLSGGKSQTNLTNGKLFELVVCSAIPDAGQRAALVADMIDWVEG